MKRNQWRPWLSVVAGGESLISSAGGALLAATLRACGLGRALSLGLGPWRPERAIHDPGKVVADLAIAVALGGDCAADLALVRAQPGVFGLVASDPTVSRLIDRLAVDDERALAAIRAARAAARAWVWRQAGVPRQQGLVVLDLDATLVTAHSDKQWAARTWKKGFGFHPLLAFVDHGDGGTGEPVAALLRKGNAGSNTCADHITVLDDALAQLPDEVTAADERGRRAILVRTDAAGATQGFTAHVAGLGMQFSVGAYLHHFDIPTVLGLIPKQAWTPAYDAEGRQRDGAWVAEVTELADLSAWPEGTRLILRKERPHPGAQLRFTDTDGLRVTGLLTNTAGGQPAALELRHRRHARVEDRIRAAKDTGLRNLPFHDAAQNAVWLEICALAQDLIAFTQRLALTGAHRAAEPKRLRLRIFGVAGRLIRTARRRILIIPDAWPWADAITAAHHQLTALATT
ncbi:MAG: IS1380 family transposase [Micromonosporaceae bacterium]|nr:IS1380 family transposase [Micromonosporaceae bacterium]